MKLSTLVIGVPVAVAAVAFSVANRAPLTLDLWPLPQPIDAPLYAVALLPFAAGVLVGGIAAYVGGGRRRAKMRDQARDIARLEREATLLKSRVEDAEKIALNAAGQGGDGKKTTAA